jgi:hypothetical protein
MEFGIKKYNYESEVNDSWGYSGKGKEGARA